jgi:hypothetical protein
MPAPNGERYPLVGGIGHHPGALPGRDNDILSEPTSSHENCLKTRTAQRPTTMAPAYFAGDRVHAVLLECSRKGRGGVSSERQTHRGCSGV